MQTTLVLFLGIGITLVTAGPAAADNERTTIVLHGTEVGYDCLTEPPPFECEPGSRPSVTVEPGRLVTIYVFLRNYDEVSQLSCRFSVDGESGSATWGDWVVLAASFGPCLPGQTASEVPRQNAPPGQEPGNLTTNFLCIRDGLLVPLGSITMVSGSGGCLGIEEHNQVGTGVWDCSPARPFTSITRENRGRVCVGPGGYDACDPHPVPVQSETWGRIKDQYRTR